MRKKFNIERNVGKKRYVVYVFLIMRKKFSIGRNVSEKRYFCLCFSYIHQEVNQLLAQLREIPVGAMFL